MSEDVFIEDAEGLTFRIDGPGGIKESYYSSDEFIAYENEYIRTFSTQKAVSANMKFEFGNAQYIAKQLEKKVTVNGLDKTITGIFYKLK